MDEGVGNVVGSAQVYGEGCAGGAGEVEVLDGAEEERGQGEIDVVEGVVG